MDDTSIERQSRLPGSQFFYPNSLEKQDAKEDAIDAATDADALVLSDPDADGIGALLAVRQKHPEATLIACGPHARRMELADGIDIALDHMNEGASVYVADICPNGLDDLDDLPGLCDRAGELHWWDHHDWDDDVREFVEDNATSLVIDTGSHDDDEKPPERCGAEIARDELAADGVTFPDTIESAIRVTGIYDTWHKQTDDDGNNLKQFIDERARDVHDYCELADVEEYLDALETHGADVFDDPDIKEAVENYREEQDKLKELVVERGEFVDVGSWTLAVTYGNGPTSDIADEFKEQGADGAIIVKPSGGVGLRGTESFQKCSDLAKQFGGGGHAKAAGCFIAPKSDGDYDRWDTDMLDMAEHWHTNGKRSRERIIEAARELAADEAIEEAE